MSGIQREAQALARARSADSDDAVGTVALPIVAKVSQQCDGGKLTIHLAWARLESKGHGGSDD